MSAVPAQIDDDTPLRLEQAADALRGERGFPADLKVWQLYT